jgi:light-regulated signal transduction histidine kinase (bacteriophytochrome)
VQSRIEIGSTADGEAVQVFMRDNDVGLDRQYAPKLFGFFQRLQARTSSKAAGSGLANVMRLIQRHGARVWEEGQVDAETPVYVSLPSTTRASNGRWLKRAADADLGDSMITHLIVRA